MLPVADIALRQIEIYTIIFFRISGIVMMMPFFGSDNVPRLVKIGLSLVITAVLVPTIDIAGVWLPENLLGMIVVVAKELLVGEAVEVGIGALRVSQIDEDFLPV